MPPETRALKKHANSRPNPQVECVSRFPGLASSYSGAFPRIAAAFSPLVSFTVIGIARKFNPRSLGVNTGVYYANTHAMCNEV